MGKKNRGKPAGSRPTGAVARNRKQGLVMTSQIIQLCIEAISRQEEWDNFVKIYEAVENLRQHQSEVVKPTIKQDRSNFIPAFNAWLEKNNVRYPNLEMHDYGGEKGYGMKCTTDIEDRSTLVEIPRSVMIKYEDTKVSYLGPLIRNNEMLYVMPNICLALYLHCEKFNPNTTYKPFIDMLPFEYNTTLYFTPEELKPLKGSYALSSAINQYRSIVRQFCMVYQLLHGTQQKSAIEKIPREARDNFTFDNYRWAVSAVTTRQNKIPGSDCCSGSTCSSQNSTLALIPLWDMFNHDDGPITTTYNDKKDQVECLAMRSFKEGEQATICYGSRGNSDLLIHNGFLITDNPFDKVKIPFGISPKDPLYHKKLQLLSKFELKASHYFTIAAMHGTIPPSPHLIAFLRIFHMEAADLEHWLQRDPKYLGLLQEVYAYNEIPVERDVRMWKFLENRINLLLMTQFKMAEYDESKLSPRTHLSIQLKQEERKVLEQCVGFCRQFSEALQTPQSEGVGKLVSVKGVNTNEAACSTNNNSAGGKKHPSEKKACSKVVESPKVESPKVKVEESPKVESPKVESSKVDQESTLQEESSKVEEESPKQEEITQVESIGDSANIVGDSKVESPPNDSNNNGGAGDATCCIKEENIKNIENLEITS